MKRWESSDHLCPSSFRKSGEAAARRFSRVLQKRKVSRQMMRHNAERRNDNKPVEA
jgi:hypothetical protein